MGKFKYKYKSIENLKRILEKQVQKELAEIDLEIEKVIDFLSQLKIEKANFIDKKDEPRRTKIIDVQLNEDYLMQLDEKIGKVEEEIVELNKKREVKLKELEEKSKEKKVFEILGEKHLNEFIKEENRLEQLEIDDIATKRYIRKNS